MDKASFWHSRPFHSANRTLWCHCPSVPYLTVNLSLAGQTWQAKMVNACIYVALFSQTLFPHLAKVLAWPPGHIYSTVSWPRTLWHRGWRRTESWTWWMCCIQICLYAYNVLHTNLKQCLHHMSKLTNLKNLFRCTNINGVKIVYVHSLNVDSLDLTVTKPQFLQGIQTFKHSHLGCTIMPFHLPCNTSFSTFLITKQTILHV